MYVEFHLQETPSLVKFINTKSEKVITKGLGRTEWKGCSLTDKEFQFGRLKRVLEIAHQCACTSH